LLTGFKSHFLMRMKMHACTHDLGPRTPQALARALWALQQQTRVVDSIYLLERVPSAENLLQMATSEHNAALDWGGGQGLHAAQACTCKKMGMNEPLCAWAVANYSRQ
jgi:hypothetical protein